MSQISSTKNMATNSWAVRMAESILRNYPEAKWKWHYEHGLVVMAISSINDGRYKELAQKWVSHFVKPNGEISTYKVDEYNLDQVHPGRLFFSVFRKTGEDCYIKAIRLLKQQLQAQPRTPSGGYWHKKIYPNQMWLDGLYMAEPFHAEYAWMFNEPELFDEITYQFILIERQARDSQTGLLYHGWDESRVQKWANPVSGCSPHFWGRALGWFIMAIVDVLDYLPAEHPNHPVMVGMLNRLAQALVRYQDPESGLWYQVVNLGGKPGNYLESSVSAMLVYGFAKAVRKGWLASEYFSSARRAYHGLLQKMLRLDANGRLTLENICSVAGLGGKPFRDGSFEYYVGEPVMANDFKGAGSFILAALEMEKDEAIKTVARYL